MRKKMVTITGERDGRSGQSQITEALVGHGKKFRCNFNLDGKPFERRKQGMAPSDLHF
jgi:hypothetical protein